MSCLCSSDAYLAFFRVGLGFASQRSRISLEEADLTELEEYCVDVGETVFGMDNDGCQREMMFNEDIHKASVDEMVGESTDWPVGAELTMSGLEARPGSFIVTLSSPLGGRDVNMLGRQFKEYLVSFVCLLVVD